MKCCGADTHADCYDLMPRRLIYSTEWDEERNPKTEVDLTLILLPYKTVLYILQEKCYRTTARFARKRPSHLLIRDIINSCKIAGIGCVIS